MLRRSRQWSGVLVVVVAAMLISGGCGGGGEEQTTTTGGGVVTTVPSGGPGDGDGLVGTLIEPTSETPSAFVDAFQTQPVVILFYVPGGRDDEKVYENLKQLEPSFGAYAFFYYNFKETENYGDLSTLLSVDYQPVVVLVDRTGVVRDVWSGFVDSGSLNQSLVNLGRD